MGIYDVISQEILVILWIYGGILTIKNGGFDGSCYVFWWKKITQEHSDPPQ